MQVFRAVSDSVYTCVHVCVCEVAGMCGQSQLCVCVGEGGGEVAWYCDDEILQYLWSDLFELFAKSDLLLMLCLK